MSSTNAEDSSLSRTVGQANSPINPEIVNSPQQAIPGFPGYAATADGLIVSLPKRRHKHDAIVLKTSVGVRGYLRCQVRANGRGKTFYVHRLVAMAFHGLPPRRESEVRHLDGNKLNNSATNLKWGTFEENTADRLRHGSSSCGSQHGDLVRAGLMNGLSKDERSRRIREGQKKAGACGSERAKRLWEKRRANAAARKAVQE